MLAGRLRLFLLHGHLANISEGHYGGFNDR
jgi:hypothetical protein